MATQIRRYMATFYGRGTSQKLFKEPTGGVITVRVPGFFIGYVPEWNKYIVKTNPTQHFFEYTQDTLEPTKNVINVKEIYLRGASKKSDLRITWGLIHQPSRSLTNVNQKKTVEVIDLDNPLLEPKPRYMTNYSNVFRSQVIKGSNDDFNYWNGIFYMTEFNIAVAPDKVLFFIFDDLDVSDEVYMQAKFERRVEV